MSTFSLGFSSYLATLAIPKLCNDGSNWSDYEPRIQKAMGLKALWRHVEGTVVAPKPYTVIENLHILADRKTPATEEQIEAKEAKIIKFEKQEYLAQHIILLTTSTRLGAKIKDMTSAEDMWKVVKADTTTRSTLYLLDVEDQLCSMKLSDNDDSKAHHNELKQHLQLMLQCRDNLIKMGSTLSDTRFNTLIMSSLPESYRPTLQTITASKQASKLIDGQLQQMKPDDLIALLIEEAQHWVINDKRTKNAETALAAHGKRSGKKGAGKGKKPRKSQRSEAEEVCKNCKKLGHKKPDCWSKGGGKEGQGLRQKKKSNKTETVTIVADKEDNNMFAFACTSDYVAVSETLQLPKSKLGTCIDSGATQVYSPDRFKFSNYRPIDRDITTADGQIVKAVGVWDLELELPNGSEWTKIIFTKAVHTPGLAFTLISISKLDKSSF
jgi:gag-polypeptide of LTR copia-type